MIDDEQEELDPFTEVKKADDEELPEGEEADADSLILDGDDLVGDLDDTEEDDEDDVWSESENE